MTDKTEPRRKYRLLQPLIQGGVELLPGAAVWLRDDQAERLEVVPDEEAVPGVINFIEAPAKPGRATKQEG
jgi:hypothetical protein